MKKNIGALVCAIIGAVLGLVGGILWATCADALGSINSGLGGDSTNQTIYLVVFIVLGIGGAVLSLIGGIQAYSYKKSGLILSVFGLLMQVGCLIAQCVAVEGFAFLLSACTVVSIILLLVATILSGKKH